MQFISTRGGMEPLGFTDVLLSGLAPDGGLAIPSEVPQLALEALEDLRDLSYAELAARICPGSWAPALPLPRGPADVP